MNVRIKQYVSVGVLAGLLAFMPVVVFAHESDELHDDNVQMAQTTAVEETDTTKPEEVKKRVSERKAALKTRLSAAKQTRIKNRCQASQGKLNSVHGRVKGLETSRTQVYQNLVNRLNKASERLAESGADVATLNQQITELSTLIEAFNTSLETYKTAVGDLAAMECATEPEGFQASLETARTARAETKASSDAIRTFLKDSIKPTLVELRKQLDNTDDTTESDDTESTNDTSQGEEN